MTKPFSLDGRVENWLLKRPFTISRGSISEAHVVSVTVRDGDLSGRGEAVPSARYGQTTESALALLEAIKQQPDLDRQKIQKLLPAGAARNALDCALWDLEAKRSGKRVWEILNISPLDEVQTSFTISLDAPAAMGAAARESNHLPILKLKLGGDDKDVGRVEAVRANAPSARLIIDANESWSPQHYREVVPQLSRLDVELIEQPFPAKDDIVLVELDRPIPVCADESCHTSADLPRIASRYDAINIKLDKTGGFTEALALADLARQAGLTLLFGCMVSTSLGIAPARILVQANDLVDLDGPLLLAKDRPHGLSYENGKLGLPSQELWG
jgi:L-alanine-DL-glutamate epimerase-like enolase superfamily enzyme